MLYGWKENSMLTNCLAAYAHLTITVSEIERDICEKIVIYHTPCIRRPRYRGGGCRRNIGTAFGTKKTRMVSLYPMVKKISKICLFVLSWSTNVTDGQTDGRSDTAWQQRPRLCIASRGKNRARLWWCIRCSRVKCTGHRENRTYTVFRKNTHFCFLT